MVYGDVGPRRLRPIDLGPGCGRPQPQVPQGCVYYGGVKLDGGGGGGIRLTG